MCKTTNGDVLVKVLLAVSQTSTSMYIDYNFDPTQFATDATDATDATEALFS